MRQIPWELIAFGQEGFFCSPTPVNLGVFSEVGTSTTYLDINELFREEAEGNDFIDDIGMIEYVESEQLFYSKFGNTFGFYKTDPSLEFGYPIASGV